MLKKNVTYEDFDGNAVTETLYFNISKVEIIEMEDPENDIRVLLQRVTAKGAKGGDILAAFKKLIGLAYGTKSEDGRRFHKDPVQTADFLSSPAYDAVFMELIQGDTMNMLKFIQAMLPSDLATDENMIAAAAQAGIKVDLPIPTPTPATSVIPVKLPVPQEKAESDIPSSFRARLDKMKEEAPKTVTSVVQKPLDEMTKEELRAEVAKIRSNT